MLDSSDVVVTEDGSSLAVFQPDPQEDLVTAIAGLLSSSHCIPEFERGAII